MLLLILFVFVLIPFKEGLWHIEIILFYKLRCNIEVWRNVWKEIRGNKMNLRLTVESSRGEILPLLVLKFPEWLKCRLKTRSLVVSINGAERLWKKS